MSSSKAIVTSEEKKKMCRASNGRKRGGRFRDNAVSVTFMSTH